MPTIDPPVDAYISKAAAFAQPILAHLRGVIHSACPEVVETIKWGMPSFLYQGGILCGIAAFKQHCSLWFWKARAADKASGEDAAGMGQFGRITKVADLPSKKALADHVRAAMQRKRDSVKAPVRALKADAKPPKLRPPPPTPDDLLVALTRNATARKTFESFSPSCKREYLEWITDAKRSDTRERRIAQAVEWIGEGKQRNWKYQNC
ncbi:MAG: YdeI/OmpD-associated family protein [Lysobacteraceae bacterium]